MPRQVPVVDYLSLDGPPHIVARECATCGARYFERRNGCAACFGTSFRTVDIPTAGSVRAFTIVTFAEPGVTVPFVAAVIDCDGTTVSANLVNVAPDPAALRLGMPVRLTTFSIGTDTEGTEAVGFGFEPLEVAT